MNSLSDAIREEASRVLADGTVAVVIGYRAGSEPFRARPAFIRTAEDVQQLVLDPLCINDLANYLPRRKEKAAIVVKGCDGRALELLIREKQVKREDVYIIGVACTGTVDLDKIAARKDVDLRAFEGIRRQGEEFVITQAAKELRVPVTELLRAECLVCPDSTPPECDTLLGDPSVSVATVSDDPTLAVTDAMHLAQRLEFFSRGFERCVRCMACVRACPACYCTTCFAEQTKPQWVPRSMGLDENRMFHLGRAMHLAGRCVDCGACEAACPVDVPLRELNARLRREVAELFGEIDWKDPESLPAFLYFLEQDTEEAIDGAV
jgi:formate dehydrogenase subunit beta